MEDLRRFELVRPVLTINKGVVGFGNTGLSLGGHVFSAPNNPPAAASTQAFTGVIDTSAEASAVGGSNVSILDDVDAGDRVRFGIVVQNIDKGDAFDVRIRDVIPAEYNRATFNPATDLHLFRGSDGTTPLVAGIDYNLISYTPATGEFIVELIDNYTAGNIGGPTEDNRTGAISRGVRTDQAAGNVPITNGSNTIILLYDVVIQTSAAPNQAIVNTAYITQYATIEGGVDLTAAFDVTGPGGIPGRDSR